MFSNFVHAGQVGINTCLTCDLPLLLQRLEGKQFRQMFPFGSNY